MSDKLNPASSAERTAGSLQQVVQRLPRRKVVSKHFRRPGIAVLKLQCGHSHDWEGSDLRKAPKTTGCGHCAKPLNAPHEPRGAKN
jgi:hypothetical protein